MDPERRSYLVTQIRNALDELRAAGALTDAEALSLIKASPTLQHTDDYSQVMWGDQIFLFEGFIQRQVIRLLHEADLRGEPWCPGKLILKLAGAQSVYMSSLFHRHPAWKKLIESNGRGLYRLNYFRPLETARNSVKNKAPRA